MARNLALLMFAFCLIAAGQNGGDQRHQQVNAQPQQKDASPPKTGRAPAAAAPVADRGVGVPKKVNCDEKNDDRRSELCAQWKAVDAAREGVQFSILSLIISSALGLISTILLIWTLGETRAISRRELRAYISARPGTLSHFRNTDGSEHVRFSFTLRNGGSTPAYELVHMGSAAVLTEAQAELHATRSWGDIPKVGRPNSMVVHSGEEAEGEIGPPDAIAADQLNALRSGQAQLYVFGLILYRDTFRKRRQTKFCYSLDADEFKRGEAAGARTPGEPRPMAWSLAPFGNDAT